MIMLGLLGPSCAALMMGATRPPSAARLDSPPSVVRMQLPETIGRVVPAGLGTYMQERITLVGTLSQTSKKEHEFLGVYHRGILASPHESGSLARKEFGRGMDATTYGRRGFYEKMGDPNKMIWWDGDVWVVKTKDNPGRRVGVVGIDGQVTAPETLNDRPDVANDPSLGSVFLLRPFRSIWDSPAYTAHVSVSEPGEQMMPSLPRSLPRASPPAAAPGAVPDYDRIARPVQVESAAATNNNMNAPRSMESRSLAKMRLEERVAQARSAAGSVEQRVQEMLKPTFQEWASDMIDTAEFERRKAAAMQEANAADAPYKALDSAVDAYSAAVRARQKAEEEEAAAEAAVYQALEKVERGA